MKTIGVVGTGKTGGEVLALLKKRSDVRTVEFNRSYPPTPAVWKSLDAAICFLPGPSMLAYFDVFTGDPKPMVIGSTGYELSPAQVARVRALPCPWVISSNFSLGMTLAKNVIAQMANWAARSGLPIAQSISETHHVQKKDAPSGTAILWRDWAVNASPGLKREPIAIESRRVEDHCGVHRYTLALPNETMSFTHDAASRAVFAEGAVWALDTILRPAGSASSLRGRVDFFDLIATTMKEETP